MGEYLKAKDAKLEINNTIRAENLKNLSCSGFNVING